MEASRELFFAVGLVLFFYHSTSLWKETSSSSNLTHLQLLISCLEPCLILEPHSVLPYKLIESITHIIHCILSDIFLEVCVSRY